MSARTGIQWTDATWNPVVGCERVSPGCAYCYAKDIHDKRHKAHLAGKKVAPQYAVPFEVVQLKPERLDQPLRWRKPRRIFVNSVADLFHEDVPDEFIDRVFAVMALTPWHTYQVLTKRPARMLAYMTERWQPASQPAETIGDDRQRRVLRAVEQIVYGPPLDRRFSAPRWWTPEGGCIAYAQPWPLPNVHLGVSAENQRFADERIPLLLQTPAAVRFLSCEPLLQELSLRAVPWTRSNRGYVDALTGKTEFDEMASHAHAAPPIEPISWVIVGGESGTDARPFDLAWARSIIAQCRAADVPVFAKQLGAKPYDSLQAWRMVDRAYTPGAVQAQALGGLSLRDRHGADMAEWPEDLKVREFPASEVRA